MGTAGRNIIDLAQNVFSGLFISDSLWNALSKQTSNFITIDTWLKDKRLTVWLQPSTGISTVPIDC
jgi:hypothetical protein